MFRIFGGQSRLVTRGANGNLEHKDVGPSEAYALGIGHAAKSKRIGGRYYGVFVILPEAIARATGQAKTYEELSDYERRAVDWLYRVILPGRLSEVGYPQPMGPYYAAKMQSYVSKNAHLRLGADRREEMVSTAAEFLKEAIRRFKTADFPVFDLGKVKGIKTLKATEDPEVLHHAMVAYLAYVEDKKGVLDWLVAHPALDRGTAGWALCYLGLDAWVQSKDSFHHSFMGDAQVEKLVRAICRRSEETGFQSDTIGLDGDPAPIIAAYREHGLPDDIPWPKAIFEAPFAAYSHDNMRYGVAEEGVIAPI